MKRYYCPACGMVADDCSYDYWRAPGYERLYVGTKATPNAVDWGGFFYELTVKPHKMLSSFATLRERELPNKVCPGGIAKDRAP